MTRWIPRLLFFTLVAAITWYWWISRPISHAPGVLVSIPPEQQQLSATGKITQGDFTLTPVASYTLRGRVLGKKRYHSGIQSGLVPVDIAVGWGQMSNQAVLDQLKVSMGNRFFFYQWWGAPPIVRDEIERSAANNHLIAATSGVSRSISRLRLGQIVEMRGQLVDAEGPGGFRWRTSRSRTDTGNGACELFLVEKITAWNHPPPLQPTANPVSTSLAAQP
jgi:hypothetical protein